MDTVFFFKQKAACEIGLSLVGSEVCIRDGYFPHLLIIVASILQNSSPSFTTCNKAYGFFYFTKFFTLSLMFSLHPNRRTKSKYRICLTGISRNFILTVLNLN